jgi:hypothetical protein
MHNMEAKNRVSKPADHIARHSFRFSEEWPQVGFRGKQKVR